MQSSCTDGDSNCGGIYCRVAVLMVILTVGGIYCRVAVLMGDSNCGGIYCRVAVLMVILTVVVYIAE